MDACCSSSSTQHDMIFKFRVLKHMKLKKTYFNCMVVVDRFCACYVCYGVVIFRGLRTYFGGRFRCREVAV